jgi:hypothetical protein
VYHLTPTQENLLYKIEFEREIGKSRFDFDRISIVNKTLKEEPHQGDAVGEAHVKQKNEH